MSLLRTPLYENIKAAGARFVPFGDWEMPVQFAGIQAEHEAVRSRAGLFDVSHMGEVEVRGPDALGAVNRLITNDLEGIVDGQALYTCMCLPSGGIVDDLVVYRFSREHIFICCNASNVDKDFAHIVEHLGPGAEARNLSERYAQLAVQGPLAPALVQRLTSVDLSTLKRYFFTLGKVAGCETLISRTGYTGEDGFELYVSSDDAPKLWDALFAAAAPGELMPIGLGARDTLRLEYKMTLYGNDIDATTTPLEAGLGWVVKLDGRDFIGKDALKDQKEAGLSRRLIGFKMDGRVPARHGYEVVDADGAVTGVVTSGSHSPSLKENIGMAYVPTTSSAIGSPLLIRIRDRAEPATVVKTPFVSR